MRRSAMQGVVVSGAGGFMGPHRVKALVDQGYWVRGVDLKEPEYEPTGAHEFVLSDLRRWEHCLKATEGIDEVYNLAANMGGIGFIESHKAEIMHDNVLINVHMLEAARVAGVERYLRLMRSDHREPLNLGSDRLVTINELVDIVAGVAGKTLRRRHDLTKPQGVRGRNSDNSRLRSALGWEPQTSLEDGLEHTY